MNHLLNSCIETYQTIQNRERNLRALEKMLGEMVAQLPERDMATYLMAATERKAE